MRIAAIIAGIAAAVIVLVVGGQFVASEWGEVIVLESLDAEGETAHTRIWVVDDAAAVWIRGNPESGWVRRVLANPEIRVERDGSWRSYRAIPDRDPQAGLRVNRLMRQKYGQCDRFIALTLGDVNRAGALPFRLEPR